MEGVLGTRTVNVAVRVQDREAGAGEVAEVRRREVNGGGKEAGEGEGGDEGDVGGMEERRGDLR